jgi:DNA-binding CsgD family transcriptional regulator
MTTMLKKGKEAFRQHAWGEAYEQLSGCHQQGKLEPEDEERLAIAAYLLGKEVESTDFWTQAHKHFLHNGNIQQAVRCAFWVAYAFFNRKEATRGIAWIERGHRLLKDGQHDCVERGYLLLPEAIQYLDRGDAAHACDILKKAIALGERLDDPDLSAMARHGLGRALIRIGNLQEGVKMLDEAMVAVDAGEISPLVAGEVYCSVISGCMEIFDLRRAQDWTTALTRWCEAQPNLVAYNGQCLVHRAEILQLHGAWPEALEAADKARRQCMEGPDQNAIGAAFYRQAELYRLQGEYEKAEEAYRQASRWGKNPQPGLSLMRLAQGLDDVAAAASKSEVEQNQERRNLCRLLPAFIEIMLAVGDVTAARHAADQLAKIANDIEAPFLQAEAAQAQGAVCLDEGNARAALPSLRDAWKIWQELEAPYQAARTRILIGLACQELGDKDTAEMEFDAAKWIFQRLGAETDLHRVESLTGRKPSHNILGLTRREMEVLRLVAAGKTNKSIADELFISERTVDRHVSNIFMKLDVASRTEAASIAYKHHLL